MARNTTQFSKNFISYGADRDRTDDLRLAKPTLSQLSYSPGDETKSKEKKANCKQIFILPFAVFFLLFLRSGPEWSRTTDPCVISTVL